MLVNLLDFADVMRNVGGVVLAIAMFLVMVMVHEFGHYVAGKILGFKITEFSVGFGPAILKKRSKKTGELFALRVIPLGGYCAFDGEDDMGEETPENTEQPFEEIAESEKYDGGRVAVKEEEYPEPKGARFNDQPPWKRIIVLVAGATMNYILALIVIVTMFACLGRPVYRVEKKAPGENASQGAVETYNTGLQTGDVIVKVDGRTIYLITDCTDALNGKSKGEIVEVLVLREGKEQTVEIPLFEDAVVKNTADTSAIFFSLGIAYREEVPDESGGLKMQMTRGGGLYGVTMREGFFQTIGNSFVYSFKIGGTILRTLGELLTGKLGIDAMGGPITTITVTAEAASNGIASFLNITALIGVNLAVFNLLPVPALDGSKVIFCLIEWIRKKPINRKVETMIHFAGIIFLFGFAILVDILQLL